MLVGEEDLTRAFFTGQHASAATLVSALEVLVSVHVQRMFYNL
jgi:hypothetical protein